MPMNKRRKIWRTHKDRLFHRLFSEKENLLSLYNAVTGSHYQNAEALKIVTLENAIYMRIKNDLAFMLETNIYLYEHQSTLNPNIPLRDLIYIGIEYQQYVDDKSLYSSRLQKIPAPKFMVFYNGTLYHFYCGTRPAKEGDTARNGEKFRCICVAADKPVWKDI